ncbi:transposase [Neobacillus niacini]|nr:transposase [Neobacillus niacini]
MKKYKKLAALILSPLSRQCKKTTIVIVGGTLILGGDFSMAKKGQEFKSYTDEFKLQAVMKYINGNKSYAVLAEELGIKNCTQLKVWVRKWKDGEQFDTRVGATNPFKGRPRTIFKSVEEERDYLKAQVDYLKKQYPNLVKEERKSLNKSNMRSLMN